MFHSHFSPRLCHSNTLKNEKWNLTVSFLSVVLASCKWKVVVGTTAENLLEKKVRKEILGAVTNTTLESTRTRIKSLIPVKLTCNYFSVCSWCSVGINEIQMQIPNYKGIINSISQICCISILNYLLISEKTF